MFMGNNRFIFSVLVILSLVFFLSLSSVSAASYTLTEANTTSQFQDIIDTDQDSDLEINLASGNYNGFTQINVNRSATIRGQGPDTVITGTGTGTGTLFNVTAPNVSIINLTITGYTTAISSNASNLTVKGNNISTNGNSISLISAGSSNPITGVRIEDNVILSHVSGDTNGAVYLYCLWNDRTVFDVLFKDNNITADGSDANGVFLGDGSGFSVISSANLVFENNNITTTGTLGHGVSLTGGHIDNSHFIFTNNTITGASTDGVYLSADSSSNSQFIFVNNTITGASGHGVFLEAYDSSNTNITFSNNIITEASEYGVFLAPYGSSNTNITFSNNTITGTDRGVVLEAFSSSNTNITFSNNIITGTDEGLVLDASGTSNSNITFDENDIFGGTYGVSVYVPGDVKDVMFLNNNITTDGDAFYFYSRNDILPVYIDNFVIKGNNIIALNGYGLRFGNLNTSSLVNITAEYNRILSRDGVNIADFNDNSSFDYNWWGVNDITGKLVGINTNNHYILNITNSSSLDDVKVGDALNFAFLVLNTTKTNVGVGKLPYFVINGTFNGVKYTTNRDDLFLYNFTITKEGIQTVVARLDDEYVVLTFNARKGNFIVDIDVKKNGDGSVDIEVTVTDEDGNPVKGHEVEINLNGEIVGTVITNKNGKAYFHIPADKLINGENTVTVTVSGDDSFNTAIKSISFIIDKKNGTDNSVVSAVMKKTGMPITPLIATPLIAILLVFMSFLGVNLRRKD